MKPKSLASGKCSFSGKDCVCVCVCVCVGGGGGGGGVACGPWLVVVIALNEVLICSNQGVSVTQCHVQAYYYMWNM